MNDVKDAGLGIRAWYRKNTRRSIRGLIGATVILLAAVVLVWIFAPLDKLQHAQTFNGALTIPGFGALWIASFMFIWLIPMREVSFRGQESMERMEEKIIPAIETWQRIGDRVENKLIPTLENAVAKLEEAAVQTKKAATLIETKAGPLIESTRRLEMKVEGSLGVIEEVREAAASISFMAGPRGTPPSIEKTLDILKSRNGVGGRA